MNKAQKVRETLMLEPLRALRAIGIFTNRDKENIEGFESARTC